MDIITSTLKHLVYLVLQRKKKKKKPWGLATGICPED